MMTKNTRLKVLLALSLSLAGMILFFLTNLKLFGMGVMALSSILDVVVWTNLRKTAKFAAIRGDIGAPAGKSFD